MARVRAGGEAAQAAQLARRLLELEGRMRSLELRIARLTAAPAPQKRVERAAQLPPRPSASRCPGCLLELPRGRRGPVCVWCGFVFAAVAKRSAR